MQVSKKFTDKPRRLKNSSNWSIFTSFVICSANYMSNATKLISWWPSFIELVTHRIFLTIMDVSHAVTAESYHSLDLKNGAICKH